VIVTVLQARMSSTRLPGKVLRPILGRPMIAHQIDRIRRARLIGRLVVATSVRPEDDAVAEAAAAAGAECARGPLDDVLARFHGAVAGRAEHVVRLTADCPLADWNVIDAAIARHLAAGADYTSNSVRRSFPVGLDVEVMTLAALEAAHREAEEPADREHVTRFLYRRPERFRIEQLVLAADLSPLRWTVDTPEDFALAAAVYGALHPAGPDFDRADVLDLLRARPDIAGLNADAAARALYRDLAAGPADPLGRGAALPTLA